MESVRLPRFKRSSAVIPIRLTERDHEILRHVRRHRFLLSDHVQAMVPGSRQQILRRLQRLYHHGYLDRPRSQLEYFHQGGSKSIVYGLDRKGAKLLAGESPPRRPWCDSKHPIQPAKQVYLQHSLLVSTLMVALENSCARSGAVRLVREEELAASANLREPFRWTVTVHCLGYIHGWHYSADGVDGVDTVDGVQLPSNRMVRQPFAGSQHDASSQADFLPGFVRTEQLLKTLFLTSIYREGGDGLEHNHSRAK